MDIIITIFSLVVLLFSIIIHELAHGSVAYSLGDPTAKYAGRLTLNPLKHLDLFGSIVLPLLLFLGKSPILVGWAKPVPINPYNFKDQKWGTLKVSIAGPTTNFVIAIIFAVIARFLPIDAFIKSNIILAFFGDNQTALSALLSNSYIALLFLLFTIVSFYNFLWAMFNLVPVPPLDGSWILFSFLPQKAEKVKIFLQQYGLFILIFLIFFGGLRSLSVFSLYFYSFFSGI